MIQCKHDGRIDFKTANKLGYCEGCHDCIIYNGDEDCEEGDNEKRDI